MNQLNREKGSQSMHERLETEITVGLITCNRPECIETLLSDLENQDDLPNKVLIGDNSTNRETRQTVESYSGPLEIKYLKQVPSTLQPEARNQLIEKTDTEYIAFLDDDVRVAEDYISNLKNSISEHSEAGAWGGPVPDSDRECNIEVDVDSSSQNQNTVSKFGEVRSGKNHWIPPHPVETDLIPGGNMVFRTEDLREIGGFDENYRGNAYCEEDDVCVRIQRQVGDIIYDPDLLVYHYTAPSGGARQGENLSYWQGRNQIYFVKKNFSENYSEFLKKLVFKTEGQPPALWKDLAGMFVYRDFSRLSKFRGYIDEVIL